MKQKIPQKSRGFTLVELLIVISIIGLLAGLAFPAMNAALLKANLLVSVSNGQEIQKAALAASLDAATNGSYTIAWPGDMTNPPADMVSYCTALHAGGFMPSYKILISNGIPTAGETLTSRNIAYSFGLVNSSTPDNVPFLTTKNFNPVGVVPLDPTHVGSNPTPTDTPTTDPQPTTTTGQPGTTTTPGTGGPLNAAAKPFGPKGFAVIRKGGDGNSYTKPTDPFDPQGPAGTFIWGLDPSRANPPVTWLQTPQQ